MKSTDYYGTIRYMIAGKRHRVGMFALIFSDNEKQWYFNGFMHRLNGNYYENYGGIDLYIVCRNYLYGYGIGINVGKIVI